MTEALESLVITCIAERSVSISVVNDTLVTLKKGRTFAKFDLNRLSARHCQRFLDTLLVHLDVVVPCFDNVLIVAVSRKMWRLFTKPYCQKKLELQAFLGLLNFYHNGLPNKAEGAKHRLLDSGVSWKWSHQDEKKRQLRFTREHCRWLSGIRRRSTRTTVGLRSPTTMSLGVKLKLEHMSLLGLLGNSIQTPVGILKLEKAYVLSHLPQLNMRPGTTKIPAAGSNIKANSQRTAVTILHVTQLKSYNFGKHVVKHDWPKLDEETESFAKTYVACQGIRHEPAKNFIDAWHDAELFATHGLPKCLVTDNSTAFKSAKFLAFLKSNSIHHITTAPFHPSSNGQAECAAQSQKKAMKVSPLATEVFNKDYHVLQDITAKWTSSQKYKSLTDWVEFSSWFVLKLALYGSDMSIDYDR
ncbi:hypothetical protein T03_4017 [Trichinella britovi]|uniref:Integrase catalytic domain-containing protein n=1 Tax=Trichinella britovi TaxID=45882 RepID=A0A0V1DAT1_TRIBR|nr:hypothetical protein T03_4017 [Trichinella britovi]